MESSRSRPFPKFTAWRRLQAALVIVVVALIIVAGAKVGWRDWVQSTLSWLRDAGPLVFFAAMALLPAVGFPLLPFTLAAGPAFGPAMGLGNVILCAVLAVTVNVALSYIIAARWLGPLAERRGWRLPPTPPRLTFPILLLLRIAPGLPFWMQSYLLGFMRAPFGLYMAVSTLVPALYITGTVLGSTAALEGRKNMALAAFGGVLIVGTILHVMRRRHAAEISALRETK